MRTPEGKTKDKVKSFLKERGAWFTVGTGLATLPIDIIGCYKGRFFAIEVKAPGKNLTKRQELIMHQMKTALAYVVWTDDAPALIEGPSGLKWWFSKIDSEK